MLQLSLRDAANCLALSLPTDNFENPVIFKGISHDTRTLQPGNLFIAIQGERFDGHDFLTTAMQKGAAAALISTDYPTPLAIPTLRVANTIEALGKLATYWRNRFSLPLIAVTGSNGKTTVKNMLNAICHAACFPAENAVLATLGNLNNAIGVPLTLARLSPTHRYAVIEMGMNHFGEIDYLTKLARPTIAIITNAGASHLEGVGNTLAGVAKAKGEIFAGLTQQGTAILNRDDDFFAYWQDIASPHTLLSFGFHQAADIRATLLTETETCIHTPLGKFTVVLSLPGKHNQLNALAATAAAIAAGIPLSAIKLGLENVPAERGRLQTHSLTNGACIIDDTYNANPFSLQAAIDFLQTKPTKKILVLGDMLELGENSIALHQAIGKKIRDAGIDQLFTYGNLSKHTAQAFDTKTLHFTDQKQLTEALRALLLENTTILIKGSRSMQMEKIVHSLLEAST